MNSVTDIYDTTNLKCLIVEYIFIDGYNTTRSKTRIIQPTLKQREYSEYSDDNNNDNHNSLPLKTFIIEMKTNNQTPKKIQVELKRQHNITITQQIIRDIL